MTLVCPIKFCFNVKEYDECEEFFSRNFNDAFASCINNIELKHSAIIVNNEDLLIKHLVNCIHHEFLHYTIREITDCSNDSFYNILFINFEESFVNRVSGTIVSNSEIYACRKGGV